MVISPTSVDFIFYRLDKCFVVEPIFFEKGITPASASCDAYNHFVEKRYAQVTDYQKVYSKTQP